MARVNQVVSFTQNEDGTQVYGVGGEIVVFHPDMANAACRTRAELHGWKQRISDKAAMSRDTTTGRSATPGEKFAAIKAMIEHYESGSEEWSLTRAGGGRRSDASYVIEALAEIHGIDVESVRARVKLAAVKFDITEAVYLRRAATRPAVAMKVAELKYGVDESGSDEMLDELLGGRA